MTIEQGPDLSEPAVGRATAVRGEALLPARPWEILWLLPKWPLPANDGARIASTSLISSLAASGSRITVVVFAAEDEAVDTQAAARALGTDRFEIVRRPATSRNPVALLRSALSKPMTALTMRYYSGRSVRIRAAAAIKQWLSATTPGKRIVVYDGLHHAAHTSFLGSFRRPTLEAPLIYRAHNREADLWVQKASSSKSIVAKLAIYHQAMLVRRFEDSVAANVDGVAVVSAVDGPHLAINGTPVRTVPIGLEFGTIPEEQISDTFVLLFVGRLDWPPNKDGLRWFLTEIWPIVAALRPDMSMRVAGSGDGRWLESFAASPRLEVLGAVEDLAPLYSQANLCVVPIAYGSGTRVKIIEASKFGRACISTELGVQGSGMRKGEHYLHAESPGEWISVLTSIQRGTLSSLAARAHQWAKIHFDRAPAAAKFEVLAAEATLNYNESGWSSLRAGRRHAKSTNR